MEIHWRQFSLFMLLVGENNSLKFPSDKFTMLNRISYYMFHYFYYLRKMKMIFNVKIGKLDCYVNEVITIVRNNGIW